MDKQSDFAAIAKLIHHVRTDTQIKLQFGATKRSELKASLESGVKPDHYRIKWLENTRDDLARWLSVQAKAFNAAHPHDSCSVADLIDVTASTLTLLRKINSSDD